MLCIDLIASNKFGDEKKGTLVQLHMFTMVDPTTGFFDCMEINHKPVDCVTNHTEMHWLS